MEFYVGLGCEGITDEQIVIANEADDITGEGVVNGFAVACEEALGVGEADGIAGAGVDYVHISLEFPGDDAYEGNSIAVFGVHVCLDFEDEGGEVLGGGRDGDVAAGSGEWRWGELEKAIEEELDAEVVGGGAEEDGCEFSGEDLIDIELGTGAFEEFEFVADLGVGGFIDGFHDGGIVDS